MEYNCCFMLSFYHHLIFAILAKLKGVLSTSSAIFASIRSYIFNFLCSYHVNLVRHKVQHCKSITTGLPDPVNMEIDTKIMQICQIYTELWVKTCPFRKLAIWCYFVKFPCTVYNAGFSMFNYMLLSN